MNAILEMLLFYKHKKLFKDLIKLRVAQMEKCILWAKEMDSAHGCG